MAFAGNFSVGQSTSSLIFTDISTGSDATITTRYIWLQRSDGSYIRDTDNDTDYWEWPLSDGATRTIPNVLTRDYSLNVSVEWYTPTPDPAGVYTVTYPELFRYYGMTFLYGLTQKQQVSRPKIISWNDYIRNKYTLISYYAEAVNAILLTGDVVNAQECLNAAYNMMVNSQQYF